MQIVSVGRILAVGVLLTIFCVSLHSKLWSQQQQTTHDPPVPFSGFPLGSNHQTPSGGWTVIRISKDQARMMQAARRKKITSDTDRLLHVTAEFKKEAGETNSDVMTPSELKKASEIEKLARDVQNQMRR